MQIQDLGMSVFSRPVICDVKESQQQQQQQKRIIESHTFTTLKETMNGNLPWVLNSNILHNRPR